MPSFQATTLSVKKRPFEMADTDRVVFTFDAREAISSVTAALVIMPAATSATGTTVTTTATAEGATVLVAGLTRGVSYELDVTFTRADGTKWTRTLGIDCVA
jgi:UDP-N-acetylglucosamine enolpyruvyl transferase